MLQVKRLSTKVYTDFLPDSDINFIGNELHLSSSFETAEGCVNDEELSKYLASGLAPLKAEEEKKKKVKTDKSLYTMLT
jgi:hypothetical protein